VNLTENQCNGVINFGEQFWLVWHKIGHFDEWHQNFGLNALKLINCFFKQIIPSAFNNNNIYFACGDRNSAQQFHMVIG
jgi:hypothetical protein